MRASGVFPTVTRETDALALYARRWCLFVGSMKSA
jgi:hypothetical protein